MANLKSLINNLVYKVRFDTLEDAEQVADLLNEIDDENLYSYVLEPTMKYRITSMHYSIGYAMMDEYVYAEGLRSVAFARMVADMLCMHHEGFYEYTVSGTPGNYAIVKRMRQKYRDKILTKLKN